MRCVALLTILKMLRACPWSLTLGETRQKSHLKVPEYIQTGTKLP